MRSVQLDLRPYEYGKGDEHDKINAPYVDAYEMPDGHLGVWCGYCDRFHYHGGGPDLGHRCAPCHYANGMSPSPYYTTGYILRAAGPCPPDLLALIKRRSAAAAARRKRNPVTYHQRYQ
jgi:hypothetical protein